MNAIRDTLRLWVVVALIGWMVGLGIPVIFRGGSVRDLRQCVDGRCAGDLPWVEIWVVGIFVILALGFLTRKRA